MFERPPVTVELIPTVQAINNFYQIPRFILQIIKKKKITNKILFHKNNFESTKLKQLLIINIENKDKPIENAQYKN